jgi:hypothetical protein
VDWKFIFGLYSVFLSGLVVHSDTVQFLSHPQSGPSNPTLSRTCTSYKCVLQDAVAVLWLVAMFKVRESNTVL